MEDNLYQRDLYLPLEGKVKKPTTMVDEDWDLLDREALGMVRLCLNSIVTFNSFKLKIIKDVMDTLAKLYEKPLASNKVFLMQKLFNTKMNECASINDTLNTFNYVTN